MERMEVDPQECYVEFASSRICERHTPGCIVKHNKIAKKMMQDRMDALAKLSFPTPEEVAIQMKASAKYRKDNYGKL